MIMPRKRAVIIPVMLYRIIIAAELVGLDPSPFCEGNKPEFWPEPPSDVGAAGTAARSDIILELISLPPGDSSLSRICDALSWSSSVNIRSKSGTPEDSA